MLSPWLTRQFGNPSGSHLRRLGRSLVRHRRGSSDVMPDVLGVAPGGVIFTSKGHRWRPTIWSTLKVVHPRCSASSH